MPCHSVLARGSEVKRRGGREGGNEAEAGMEGKEEGNGRERKDKEGVAGMTSGDGKVRRKCELSN